MRLINESRHALASVRSRSSSRLHCRRLRPTSRVRAARPARPRAITPRDLEVRLTAFAHDSMMGREAGTIWNAKATDYVAAQFAKSASGRRATAARTSRPFRTFASATRPRRAAPARNVIAIFPGSDPALRGEYVSITAHNDHVGYTHRPVDHDSLRAFNTVIRPLGADSPTREPSADECARIRKILDSLRALRPPRPDSIRQRRRRRRQRNDRADRDRRSVRARQRANRAGRFCSSRTRPKRRDCSARSGTPTMLPFRSTRSSRNSTST